MMLFMFWASLIKTRKKNNKFHSHKKQNFMRYVLTGEQLLQRLNSRFVFAMPKGNRVERTHTMDMRVKESPIKPHGERRKASAAVCAQIPFHGSRIACDNRREALGGALRRSNHRESGFCFPSARGSCRPQHGCRKRLLARAAEIGEKPWPWLHMQCVQLDEGPTSLRLGPGELLRRWLRRKDVA
jgi:hypothetical protein